VKSSHNFDREVQERQEIKNELNRLLNYGEKNKYNYIISINWFDSLLEYLNTNNAEELSDLKRYPELIDNSDIIQHIY
jgi:hypothetical protein